MLVAIDTATAWASLALFDGRTMAGELSWRSERRHGDILFEMLERLVSLAGARYQQIDRIAVATGPGSFTGIRIGIATARGLARGSGAAIAGVSTLEILAYPHAAATLPVCALLPAGRDEWYAAFFQQRGGEWARRSDYIVGPLEEIRRHVDGETLFVGEIDAAAEVMLREHIGSRARFVTPAARLRRAAYLAELGWRALEARAGQRAGDLEPVYLKQASVRDSTKQSAPAALAR